MRIISGIRNRDSQAGKVRAMNPLLEQIISGAVGGIIAATIVTSFTWVWIRTLIGRYKLTKEARQVLECLWDENVLRRPDRIANETHMNGTAVLKALRDLEEKHLAIERHRKNGNFWKIILRGKDYLSQLPWLGGL
jgi:hypothetical protein